MNSYLNGITRQSQNYRLFNSRSLVEIDLLRSGQPLPILGNAKSYYRTLVSRSESRPSAQLYAFNLQQKIPSFPIPLTSSDEEPSLDCN